MQSYWSFIFFDSLFRFTIPRIGETALNIGLADKPPESGLLVILLLILAPAFVALFFLIRFFYRSTIGKKFKTTLTQDYKKQADTLEKGGRFVSAASMYEKRLKDSMKAAELYEKGKDYKQAAMLYESLGMTKKAQEVYEKDGNFERSAEISIREGDYEEAAKLYDKAGKKVDAAITLEKAGRKLAAVRAYREAGEYRSAARLLEEEDMGKEAVEMFGLSLHEQKPEPSNIDDFYTYGSMLEKIGDIQKALEVFKEIDRVDPLFRDVREKIHTLAASGEKDEVLEGKTTLRSFIKAGRIEPKYGLKLWVHILKSLQETYSNGRPYGLLSPDNIVIDAQNNISFLNRTLTSAYVSPESTKGLEPDVRADIYSSGVILYEMLTGSLDGLGSVRVIDIVENVPDWLDEIVVRCIKKVREDRYKGMEDIFVDLKNLSKGKKSL